MQQFFGRGEIAATWQVFHAPLIALGISATLALLGTRLRYPLALAAAGGAAVLAGWGSIVRSPLTLWPHGAAERLVLFSAATLLIAAIAEKFVARRGAWPPLLLIALGCGWWMAGAARSGPGVLAAWPIELIGAVAVIVVAWLSGIPRAAGEPLRPAMAACTLAAALHVIGAPWLWIMVAFVPAAACVPLMLLPRLSVLALLPVTADLAAAQVGVLLSIGRLAHGTLTLADAAALSPLLSLWLFPHAATRFGVTRWGRLVVAAGCGAVAVAIPWGVKHLRGG
jgi:hypothetical protein